MIPAVLTKHSLMHPRQPWLYLLGLCNSLNHHALSSLRDSTVSTPAELLPLPTLACPHCLHQVPMATFPHQDPCWAPSAKASYQDTGTGPSDAFVRGNHEPATVHTPQPSHFDSPSTPHPQEALQDSLRTPGLLQAFPPSRLPSGLHCKALLCSLSALPCLGSARPQE